jgi:hypothetical protein
VSDDKPASPPDKGKDMLLVLGESAHGHAVVRKREQSLEVGEIRPMQHGKPVHGEVVKLAPRGESDRLFDVEVVVPREARAGSGPAQVATDAYRANWEAIFGGERADEEREATPDELN